MVLCCCVSATPVDGDRCTTYDVAVNSVAVVQALRDDEFKELLVNLSVQYLDEKYQLGLCGTLVCGLRGGE